ncbi:hypothetical protein LguiB_006048 [Lonicera macranthoides]
MPVLHENYIHTRVVDWGVHKFITTKKKVVLFTPPNLSQTPLQNSTKNTF